MKISKLRFWTRLLLLSSLLTAATLAQTDPPLALARESASPQDREAYYRGVIEKYSGERPTGEVWVLALRGLSKQGRYSDSKSSAGGYVDTLVVVTPSGVEEFQAATHSGTQRSEQSPWGVPLVRPGRYFATPLSGGEGPTWQLMAGEGQESLPSWLDRNFDGKISSEEQEFDDHYGTATRGFFIQNGEDQTRPRFEKSHTLPPSEYRQFVSAVGRNTEFNYLVLDANAPQREILTDLRNLTTPLSPLDDFKYYEKIALKKGVKPGFRQLVIALRGMAPNGHRHRSEENVGPYNDTFLVLHRYPNGETSVRAFLGSTHAGQASSLRIPAVYAGVAQVRPGLYYARSYATYHRLWSWHVVSNESDHRGALPSWRDKDKDGFLSLEEKRLAEKNGVTANEILIHNGIDDDTGNSIGCLTLPPDVMVDFISHVGHKNSFPLLLLDANQNP